MNASIIMKTLTSRPARKVYKQIGKHSAKIAAGIAGEAVIYFGGQGIIKVIKEKTNFKEEKTCIIIRQQVTEV